MNRLPVKAQCLFLQQLVCVCVCASVTSLPTSLQEIYSTQFQHHDKILHPSHCLPHSPPHPTSSYLLTVLSMLLPKSKQTPEIISLSAAGPFAVHSLLPFFFFCHASILYNSNCLGVVMVEMCLLLAFTPSISTTQPGVSVRGWQ